MILPIVHYGNPILQQKGSEIKKVTSVIKKLVRDMIETMHAARGVGLAAQQIGRAVQLTVIDIRGAEQPSQAFLGVREISPDSLMPLILINPKITQQEGQQIGSEGCLSFPGISAEISRANTIHASAIGLEEELIQFVATGLLSRAIQHELDHLNGILFIDRMSPSIRKPIEPELRKIEKETLAAFKKGSR